MIKFKVLNRWSGSVQFTAEIECGEDAPLSIKAGLALRWGYKSGADLRGADLRDADMRDADMRDADMRDAVLRGADLRGAVLRGAVLRDAVLSGADLRGAVLRGADMRDAVLSGAVLSGADMRGAVLCDAVLRGAVLSGADLRDAVLRGAVLSGADLRDAVLSENAKSVPVVPNIDAAILEAIEGGGTLKMNQWHTCGTTHCRGGWAVILAGAGGAALEWAMGTGTAAALIYAASRPGKPVPNFFATEDVALADIKASAEEARAALPSLGDVARE